MIVNENVKRLIQQEGLTYSEFGRRIGATRQRVTSVASGLSVPRADLIDEILKAYPQYSAEWLLRNEGPMKKGKTRRNVEMTTLNENYEQYKQDPWELVRELRAELRAERKMKEYFLQKYEMLLKNK